MASFTLTQQDTEQHIAVQVFTACIQVETLLNKSSHIFHLNKYLSGAGI